MIIEETASLPSGQLPDGCSISMDVSMHPSIMSSAWPYVNTLRIMHAFNVELRDECIE